MGDAAALITAIAGLVSAVGGMLGAVAAVRALGRRERRRSGRRVAAQIRDAARDGVITVDELNAIADESGEDS